MENPRAKDKSADFGMENVAAAPVVARVEEAVII
jgi:hypothetical protein